MTPATRIKSERLRRGFSQAQLAEAIGVSEDVIQNTERGGRPVPANRMLIARYFEWDVIETWGLDDDPAPEEVAA